MLAAPATDRQVSYITALLEGREAPTTVTALLSGAGSLSGLDRAGASRVIDLLLAAPRKAPAAPAALVGIRAELAEALGAVPKSKYAVPASHLFGALHDYTLTNDMLFVEVREYRGTLYMRRLSGAPGAFSRARLTTRDTLSVARILASRALEYIQAFGEHYTCCGKCGAELTDAASRARFLGPDCARQLGVL